MKQTKIFMASIVMTIASYGGEKVPGCGYMTKMPDAPHGLVVPYEGSTHCWTEKVDFDEFPLVNGKFDRKAEEYPSEKIAGKITRMEFMSPANKSVFEISSNYENALKENGFNTIYTTSIDSTDHDHKFLDSQFHRSFVLDRWRDKPRYISATKNMDGKQIWVAIFSAKPITPVENRVRTLIAVIEGKPMATNKVQINSQAMFESIQSQGRVSIYGVNFEFDKDTVLPNSESTLNEIAKLLKEHPTLKLYVVGHTDQVGEEKYNINLSSRRAKSVTNFLTTKYGISMSRLRGVGLGPFAPVASNETEEGRAKNRRVELVNMLAPVNRTLSSN